MEENIILTNIATILTKDVLIDEPNSTTSKGNLIPGFDMENPKFPLLEKSDDDDIEAFFLKQKREMQEQQQQKQQQQQSEEQQEQNASEKAKEEVHEKEKQWNAKDNTNKTDGEGIKMNNNLKRPLIRPDNIENPVKQVKIEKYPSIDLLNLLDTETFQNCLHLSKMSFLRIYKLVRTYLDEKEDEVEMPSQSVFSLAMWKLTTDEHFEVIANKFQIPLNDTQKIIRHFWSIISDKYEQFIKWPNSRRLQKDALEAFFKYPETKVFNNLYGIIALKRLEVFLEHVDGEVPLILQIVCNGNNEIIDCFVELAKDYSFDDSPIGQTLDRIEHAIPSNCYLVGDSNFPLREYLMRPIEDECFNHEEVYNQLISKVYVKAHDVLDTMARRFNILYALEAKDLKEVRKIIETVCALHNLCIHIDDDSISKHKEVVKFNWGNTNRGSITIKNKVRNERGSRRRNDLIEEIIH